ncbi:Neuronal acetylcholine receptor subunit alpha-6 like [Actinidia chinensis var. chinensis]|uniref:Neuronal acetylcholine receptor subunit alpha-6 like n=1 Tax=Actinidia chinensis var. chinensis TaxID=1590841 RepID=A0A2R6QMW3_ACTCC|nr:Neuronal acetylcholine receptor subunit alpha-6 like [Actinidia chinensis var. chinensis]
MDLRSQIIRNSTNNDAILDQIIQYTGKSCKQETQTITNPNNGHMLYLPSFNTAIDALQDWFTHLPRLEIAPTNSPFVHEALDDMFLETEPSCKAVVREIGLCLTGSWPPSSMAKTTCPMTISAFPWITTYNYHIYVRTEY